MASGSGYTEWFETSSSVPGVALSVSETSLAPPRMITARYVDSVEASDVATSAF